MILSSRCRRRCCSGSAAMRPAGRRRRTAAALSRASHQVFGDKCERCHVTQARAFRAHITDNMCVSCHDAPHARVNQTFTPTCASCHLEHRGARPPRGDCRCDCVECHRDLKTTTGRRRSRNRSAQFQRRPPGICGEAGRRERSGRAEVQPRGAHEGGPARPERRRHSSSARRATRRPGPCAASARRARDTTTWRRSRTSRTARRAIRSFSIR